MNGEKIPWKCLYLRWQGLEGIRFLVGQKLIRKDDNVHDCSYDQQGGFDGFTDNDSKGSPTIPEFAHKEDRREKVSQEIRFIDLNHPTHATLSHESDNCYKDDDEEASPIE